MMNPYNDPPAHIFNKSRSASIKTPPAPIDLDLRVHITENIEALFKECKESEVAVDQKRLLEDTQKRIQLLLVLLQEKQEATSLKEDTLNNLYILTKALKEHNFKEASETNLELMKSNLDPWMIGMKRLIDLCQRVKVQQG